MKKFVSIKKKLTINTMIIITVIFIAVLTIVTWINIQTVSISMRESELNIRNALLAKGNTLIRNNSISMSGMAEDNAFTAIRELVVSTVQEDPDLIYGIYMDDARIPWVHISPDNPDGIINQPNALDDDTTKWAAAQTKLPAYKEYIYKNEAVIEFAAPVFVENEVYGFIRYGFTTCAMRESLQKALAESIQTRNKIIGILVFLGIISITISFLPVRRLSNRITQPVAALVESTKIIASGNYDIPVTSDSNDEIGLLVKDVDSMRISIRELTENLKEQERLKNEMALARKIQTSLLPTLADNIHPDLEIAALMLPADQVGGDFYDITYDRSGGLWFAIGDVSGHGVTPGLIMMMAQTIHSTVTSNMECDARSVVIRVNEVLYKNVNERLHENHFMTFTSLKYLEKGRFQHAGAHLSMILCRKKNGLCELIRTRGIYLNFKKDISRATKNGEFLMEPGDVLVLYTDGLTEAEDKNGTMLDVDRFVKIVEKYSHLDCKTMKKKIIDDVLQWSENYRADDMTIVIIRRKEEQNG